MITCPGETLAATARRRVPGGKGAPLRRACAGALTVTRAGAQPSLPAAAEPAVAG
ncbi:hypothetical protein [Pseudonocardia nigra]|uniref:hypothetical protein n=1 Tax=Pseudonocardia nigra TaxID=1921578 RepID=UPI001C5E7D23|nr:hypothetical protein [Pseudonocardia nigra]